MPTVNLTTTTPAHDVERRLQVEPSEEKRSVSFQAPTPEIQEYIQKNIIEPTAKAYGVNPKTGEVTPFQALGYNPEDERKRREAGKALNDRKRKENAWYNAFAVVGDSLTAALGGNVWQRQPNHIGAKAIAENQRLIAEQKAENVNNAANMRNAGVKYADAVNRLIQKYLTRTTTTSKTGGTRTVTTSHPEVVKTRDEWHKDGSSTAKKGRSEKSASKWDDNAMYEVGLRDKNGNVQFTEITGKQAKELIEIARKAYGDALESDNYQVSDKIRKYLGPSVVQQTSNGKYDWNDWNLLQSGIIFDTRGMNAKEDATIRDFYSRITGQDYRDMTKAYDLVTPAMQAIQGSQQKKPAATSPQKKGGRLSASNSSDRSATR